jgi:hypothetical protein
MSLPCPGPPPRRPDDVAAPPDIVFVGRCRRSRSRPIRANHAHLATVTTSLVVVTVHYNKLHRSEGATSLLWPLSQAPRAATPRNLLPATPSAATKGGEGSGVAERRVG